MYRRGFRIHGLAAAALLLIPAYAASAYRTNRYCMHSDWNDRWDPSRRVLRVLLHESLVAICGGDLRSCNGSDAERRRQLERAVGVALADFNTNSGADVRFDLQGWTSDSSRQTDAILVSHYNTVFEGTCPGGLRAMADHRKVYTPGTGSLFADQGRVLFCTQNMNDQTFRWVPWSEKVDDTPGAYLSAFIPTLKHEMLHVIGLRHPTECGGIEADADHSTIMDPGRLFFMWLAREDIRFLRDHFGARPSESKLHTSEHGLTWQAVNDDAPASASVLGRPVATNTREGSNAFLAWRQTENALALTRVTASGTWIGVTSLGAGDAPYFPGIARFGNDNVVVAYQKHESGWAHLNTFIRASSDGGHTWTQASERGEGSRTPGVAMTHDPVTGHWLILVLGDHVDGRGWRIRYRSVDSDDTDDQLAETWLTPSPPSMACAPATAGSFNCLLTWQTDGWEPTVNWTQCRVRLEDGPGPIADGNDVKLDCLPRQSLGYLSVSTAPVAFTGATDGYPWQIALSQGGRTVYTWRKAVDPAAAWIDQRSINFSGVAGVPAVGAAGVTATPFRLLAGLPAKP